MPHNPLQALIEASAADPSREPEFLTELLEAPLFFHLPLVDDGEHIRLVQFRRSDGLSVIPVFSDFDRAHLAAQGNVRVGTARGRDLLEATRGATLMLDPNDTSCTLYPEEIAALLDDGIALSAPVKAPTAEQPMVGPAGSTFGWIGDLVVAALAPFDHVQAIWLVQRIDLPLDAPPAVVVVVGVAPQHVERAIRALGLACSAQLQGAGVTVDATSLDPQEKDPWPTAMGIQPHWCRGSYARRH